MTDKEEGLIIRGFQVIYSLEHATRVKNLLVTSKSVCHSCPYKKECESNELCTDALYAYIFHDYKPLPECDKQHMSEEEFKECRNERRTEKQRREKRISRAIDKIQEMSPGSLKNRKGKHNENLWSLRKPVFVIMEDFYLSAAIRVDEFWRRGVIKYSRLSNIVSDLEIILSKYQDIIKESKIEIHPKTRKNYGYKVLGEITLKDDSIVKLDINLSSSTKSPQPAYVISYSVAWIKKDGTLLYVWDNHDNVGKDSAPFHVHIGERITKKGRHKNPQQTWMVPSLVSMFCLIRRAYNEDGNYSEETLEEIHKKYSKECYSEDILIS